MRILRELRRARLLSVFALVFPLIVMVGCGGGGGASSPTAAPGTTASFAFVANSGSADVSAFAVSTTGALSAVPGSPFQADAGAEFMALDSVHEFLFVSNQNSNNLSAFSVSTSSGVLTPVPGSPFPTGAMPHGVAVDPMGRFVFVGNQNDNSVSVFSINGASGALAPVPGSPFKGIDSPFGVAVNPAGTFLFVNDINTNTVTALKIDSNTGALTAVPGLSFPTGQTPIGLVADPNGKFLYVGDHMQDTVSAYRIDPMTGALARISGPPAASLGCGSSCHVNPLRLAIHPKNEFAYVTDVGGDAVSPFSLTDGVLSPISAPVPTGRHPFGLAFDPTGSFLFVVNKVDNNISAFSIDSMTGALSALPGSPFPAGGSAPAGIVTVPKR